MRSDRGKVAHLAETENCFDSTTETARRKVTKNLRRGRKRELSACSDTNVSESDAITLTLNRRHKSIAKASTLSESFVYRNKIRRADCRFKV